MILSALVLLLAVIGELPEPTELTGTVVMPLDAESGFFGFKADELGYVSPVVWDLDQAPELKVGDRLRLRCSSRRRNGFMYTFVDGLEELGRTEPPRPLPVSVHDLVSNERGKEGPVVAVRGRITDVYPDDGDAIWTYFLLEDRGERLYLAVASRVRDEFQRLIGAEVEVTAFVHGSGNISRRFIHHLITSPGLTCVKRLAGDESLVYECPEVSGLYGRIPSDLPTEFRHREQGEVIAVSGARRFLIRTAADRIVFVESSVRMAPPVGETVEVAGYPVTDLQFIHLGRSLWRPAAGGFIGGKAAPPEKVHIRRLITGEEGRETRSRFVGRPVEIEGEAIGSPVTDNGRSYLQLEDGGLVLKVDVTAAETKAAELEKGTRLRLRGIWVAERDGWSPINPFPLVRDRYLVLREPADLAVVKGPPFWTPARFAAFALVLVAVFALIVLWNLSLHALVSRRSRELIKEQTKKLQAELRISERTRIATELHDTIAQSLTGIAMEVEAAKQLFVAGTDSPLPHLQSAGGSLKACRRELRDCLWDLRCDALGEKDFAAAIRKTLVPFIDRVELAIRFNVPRRLVSDQTAHAVLRIIREFVTNATRHGGADRVKIAGDLTDGTLAFSVTDNGCGFDAERAPGAAEGHFGLQGVRERVAELGGVFELSSTPGGGTRARVTISLRI